MPQVAGKRFTYRFNAKGLQRLRRRKSSAASSACGISGAIPDEISIFASYLTGNMLDMSPQVDRTQHCRQSVTDVSQINIGYPNADQQGFSATFLPEMVMSDSSLRQGRLSAPVVNVSDNSSNNCNYYLQPYSGFEYRCSY
jgi:hypothetical protein